MDDIQALLEGEKMPRVNLIELVDAGDTWHLQDPTTRIVVVDGDNPAIAQAAHELGLLCVAAVGDGTPMGQGYDAVANCEGAHLVACLEHVIAPSIISLDFGDLSTLLTQGGKMVAIEQCAQGDQRITQALKAAAALPLSHPKDVIVKLESCADDMVMAEMNELTMFMEQFDNNVNTLWGVGTDPSLQSGQVRVTVLASGLE